MFLKKVIDEVTVLFTRYVPAHVLRYMGTPEFIWYTTFAIVHLHELFTLYVDYRQHRAISQPKRPKELKDLCTEEEFTKSRDYAMDCSRFGLIYKAYNRIINTAILFGGIYLYLWELCGKIMVEKLGYPETSDIIRAIIFQWMFLLINQVQSLPFSLYRTFWLEKKHDFNKTTVRTFIMDIIKGIVLGFLFTAIILGALLWVMKKAENYIVIATCSLALVIQMIMVLIYPTVIQPLFNKFTPLEDGELKDKINALAERIKFPLTKIFVIDGSTRSSHSNAYFFGVFKDKRIVLFDTLIKQMSVDEVTAVMGHELGHWYYNHMFHGLAWAQLYIIGNFYLFSLVKDYSPLYAAFGFKDRPHYIGLSLFSSLMTPLSFLFGILMTWQSRRREFEADRYAIDLGYGETLPQALTKLYNENKSFTHPDWLYSTINYSHPPPSERIATMHAYSMETKKKRR